MASPALKKQQQQQQDSPSKKRLLLDGLKLCSSTRSLRRGQQIHAEAIQCGLSSCSHVAATLINMYAKCGRMCQARDVFDEMKQPDVVAWNALILGYAENGEGAAALALFAQMGAQECVPSSITFIAALKACISLALDQNGTRTECLERGREVHSYIGCHSSIYVESTLIDMYAKCGSMLDARQVFESMKNPNVVAWNALLLGYADNGQGATALEMLARMNCAPDGVTFIAALKACTSLAVDRNGRAECLQRGREIHSRIGCHINVCVQSSLIDMYAKCGCMAEARRVFDDMKQQNIASWNALILGYAENGEGATGLDMLARMRTQGCAPSSVTFIAALKACSSIALDQDEHTRAECLRLGKEIHSEIGCHCDKNVQNTLIDMYAKCGSMVDAREVFDSMKHPDTVSWNALILGYAKNGEGSTALDVFARMKSQGCTADSRTFASALKACSLLGDLESASKIRVEMEAGGIEWGASQVTNLVDFYGKCGSMTEAQEVFDAHPGTRDLISWNSLLAGYSRLGDDTAVFRVFSAMQDAGFVPDAITFSCVLLCCCHAELVEKASELFAAMPTKYGITPTVEHCNCMVDILGRSNKLHQAMALLRSMACRPNASTWMTALGACQTWKNVGIASLAFQHLVALEDMNSAAYLLMADIYGSRGMWKELEIVLEMERSAMSTACHRTGTVLSEELPLATSAEVKVEVEAEHGDPLMKGLP